VEVQRLDHVALRVRDPERAAARLLRRLPFRILQQTDELLLLGRGPDLAKLTLLEGSTSKNNGILGHVAIRIPAATSVTHVELEDALDIRLVPAAPEGDIEVGAVALAVEDPQASARAWRDFGFTSDVGQEEGERLRVGDIDLLLTPAAGTASDLGRLDHLGLLVASLDETLEEATEQRLEIDRVVDADNSRAAFVEGPDGVTLEYIEHKPSFALA
jgi:catechol 2,3-dioxygenase-like lactoylglutathione lyase family enzyme